MEDKKKTPHMLVHCPECEAMVQGEVLARHTKEYFEDEVMRDLPDSRVSLVTCPSCDNPVVVHQRWEGEGDYGDEWSKPIRVWPRPEAGPLASAPEIVRVSLEEAHRCHRAGAYMACAVMCGRALEGVLVHFETDRTLAKGLKQLLDKGVIDGRLFQWSEELRKHRNLAAHASAERISREDATDLVEFLTAICDYVFVLTPKFQAFMSRKAPGAHASG